MLRKVTLKKVMKPSATAMRALEKKPKPTGMPQMEMLAWAAAGRPGSGWKRGRSCWRRLLTYEEERSQLEYSRWGTTAQTELLPAADVARQTPVIQAENGICYATFGDHKLPPGELEQVIGAVPRTVAGRAEASRLLFCAAYHS